jgi:solute carrier family 25 glutamate transporter 18/22
MLAGGCAGLCQVIVTTPMELLKIQIQRIYFTPLIEILYFYCTEAGRTGMTATGLAMNLLKEKGIYGLYRGIGPTIARDVSFSVIYFPLFAALDAFVNYLENYCDTKFSIF